MHEMILTGCLEPSSYCTLAAFKIESTSHGLLNYNASQTFSLCLSSDLSLSFVVAHSQSDLWFGLTGITVLPLVSSLAP